MVKELHSVSVKYVYYCTLKINGAINLPNTTINYTNINYTINWLNTSSVGSMVFTNPINMVWMQANFYKMFNVFWRASTFRDDNLNRTLLDFVVDDWGSSDNMTLNFTMTFESPYIIGLLLKQ